MRAIVLDVTKGVLKEEEMPFVRNDIDDVVQGNIEFEQNVTIDGDLTVGGVNYKDFGYEMARRFSMLNC